MNSWYIAHSRIHGKGVFAKKLFVPGEVVCLAFVKVHNTGIPSDDLIRTEFCAFINHQENGNIELFQKGPMYIARCNRIIYENEEITCDYNKGYAFDISGGWPPK